MNFARKIHEHASIELTLALELNLFYDSLKELKASELEWD